MFACNAAPCADTAPPLLVLEARLRVLGPDGERDIPIDDYFAGPGETRLARDEIVTSILLDPPCPSARSVFLKKKRVHMDLALASVAVLVEMGGDGETCSKARVAAGSVAPKPLRLHEVEGLLEGQRITEEILTRAVDLAREGVSPISDVRASAEYRRHVTGVLLRRALQMSVTGAP